MVSIQRQENARRRGFTLIELLVVIGVIAVLLSLLMPALSAVRAQALRSKCASNLRMIGSSIIAYAADHNGYVPTSSMPGVVLPGYASHVPCCWDPNTFVKPLVPYGLEVTRITCPASVVDSDPAIQMLPGSVTWGTGEWGVNYCYFPGLADPRDNAYLNQGPGGAMFYDTINAMPSLRPFVGPSKYILLGEMNIWWDVGATSQFTTNHGGGSHTGQLADLLKVLIGTNRFYVDGHGEWIPPSRMGKNDTLPSPTDDTTAHYSHSGSLGRPYYW